MILHSLLRDLDPIGRWSGDPKIQITALTSDSRQVEPGSLFVAYVGENVDAHRYIPQAVEGGAAAIVGERERPDDLPPYVPYVQVPDGRVALAQLAAAWHGHPSREMTVIGVTGTEGKTTTVNLVRSILAAAGLRTGMISTVNALIGDRSLDTGLHVTTPDAPQIQALLAEMVAAGTQAVVLEATSHGLAQHRVTAVDFDVAVVTNITHSHLNYHGTWEQYCADKARLFHLLSTAWRKPGVPKAAVLNADDRSYSILKPIPADRQLSYALEAEANVTASDERVQKGERTFTVHAPGIEFPVRTRLVERYNMYNILAAACAALALDLPAEAIYEGVYAIRAVSGHMERVEEGQDYAAIVDFAHSPNALEQALSALRAETTGRLIVVFGCAGQRDVLQRGMMGEIAGRLADATVITAEDPRTEDLDEIIDAIAQGCERGGAREGEGRGARYYRVPDRVEAIAFAVGLARPGDVVVAAGKGHEQSMCFGTVEYPWDDRVVMRAALLERLGRAVPFEVPRLPTARE